MARGHEIGTVVQEKTGRVRVKVGKNKWSPRGRLEYQKAHRVLLNDSQRVFHIDGDKRNDDPKNLVPITFSGRTYNLQKAVVLWRPSEARRVIAVERPRNGSRRVAAAA